MMNDSTGVKQIVVGITGASGAPYAIKLIKEIIGGGAHVHLVITSLARRLLFDELGITEISAAALIGGATNRLTIYNYKDVGAKIGSGSFLTAGMIVCPCSSNTLGAIAAGLAGNLISRAAAVTLKESRRLILVPREMPISRIDLLNALRLSEAGAVICPASPGFYMLPKTIDDLVDFVVGRICDQLGIKHPLMRRWGD